MSLLSLCAVPITKQKKQIYFSRPVTIHPNFENTLNFATPSELSKTHGTRKPVTTLNHASKFRKYCSVCFENLFMVVLPTEVFFWYESYLFLLNFLVQICPSGYPQRYIQVSRVTSCTSVPEDDSPSPAVALYVKRTSFPCPLLAPCFRSVPRSPCVAVALLLLVLDDSISPWSRVDASRVGVCRAKRLSAPTWIALFSSVRHETRRMGR